jgi:hypothetical protein
MNCDEIRKLADVNCIMYTDIEKFATIDDMLHPISKACVILIQYTDTIGHFVCTYLATDPDNRKVQALHWFDSFGREKNYFEKLHKSLAKTGRNEYTKSLFFDLLRRSNVPSLNWFDYKIQNDKSKLCGAWCLLRIKHKDMSDSDFYKRFKNHEKELGEWIDKHLVTTSYNNWFF